MITYQYGVTKTIHISINAIPRQAVVKCTASVMYLSLNIYVMPTPIKAKHDNTDNNFNSTVGEQLNQQGKNNIAMVKVVNGNKNFNTFARSLNRLCVALNDLGTPKSDIATMLYITTSNINFDKQSIIIFLINLIFNNLIFYNSGFIFFF